MTLYLPSGDNITLLNAKAYFLADGATRPASVGYIDSFSWTPSIEKAEKSNGNSGVQRTIKTKIKKMEAEVSVKLAEVAARQLAMALQATSTNYTQAAVKGATITATNVVPGELVDLGALRVSEVSAVAGAVSLVEGVNYVLMAEAGAAEILTPHPEVIFTASAPEITAADARVSLSILANAEGVKGVWTLIGTNQDGERGRLDGVRTELTPSGAVSFISEDGDFQSIELSGKCVSNPALPLTPFGRWTVIS